MAVADNELQNTIDTYYKCGRDKTATARELGVSRGCVFGRLERAKALGLFDPSPKVEELADLPDATSHYEDWDLYELPGPMRILRLSDVHIPYHSREAVQVAVKYGKDHGANTILLSGDIFDFFTISRWEKDPRKRNLPGEIEAGRQFLRYIRREFPDARIVFKEGNHEERWESYLRSKAPELLGLDEFTWQGVYRLNDHAIEHVGDRRPIQLGKLIDIHGHEYRFNISNPVNPARGLFLRGKVHAICGHFHQTSQHSEKRLDNHVVATWSTGCLCDLHPDYAPINNWNHGFVFAEIGPDGDFAVTNLRIVNGKAYM